MRTGVNIDYEREIIVSCCDGGGGGGGKSYARVGTFAMDRVLFYVTPY